MLQILIRNRELPIGMALRAMAHCGKVVSMMTTSATYAHRRAVAEWCDRAAARARALPAWQWVVSGALAVIAIGLLVGGAATGADVLDLAVAAVMILIGGGVAGAMHGGRGYAAMARTIRPARPPSSGGIPSPRTDDTTPTPPDRHDDSDQPPRA